MADDICWEVAIASSFRSSVENALDSICNAAMVSSESSMYWGMCGNDRLKCSMRARLDFSICTEVSPNIRISLRMNCSDLVYRASMLTMVAIIDCDGRCASCDSDAHPFVYASLNPSSHDAHACKCSHMYMHCLCDGRCIGAIIRPA